MSTSGGIIALLGYWGTSVVAIFTLIGLCALTVGREWCKREWRFLESAALIPGPPALPFIGNLLHFACSHDEILDRLVKLAQPYEHPFRFWLGPKLVIMLTSPRDLEVVLNSSTATHKPCELRFMASYWGSGILANSGAIHRTRRKLVMPMVNGNSLNSYLECFDRQSQWCVKRLGSRVDTGKFDISHYMDDCTLDMVLETIMGTAGTVQQNGYKGVIDSSARAVRAAHERSMKGWLHMDWIYFRTEAGQQYINDMGVLHKFTETLVNEKKEEFNAAKSETDFENRPLISVLDRLTAFNMKTQLMDDKELRDEVANIWIPAQDPTALTSSFLFMMLGMHPEIQDKVRAEVRDVVGEGDITLEQISKLRYLEMVFKETIRLFPIGPLLLREPQEDLHFASCTAPKGCTITLFVYGTHRDPKYWTEPEKFMPERFTPENSVGRHPFAFVPFSSGIRGCIGRQYANMLLKTLVARVIQKYRIECSSTMDTLRLRNDASIRSIDGYHVSITKV